MEVKRQGSRVAFLCRDDGQGLDTAAVRSALAQRRGDVSQLSDNELLSELVHARISTAARVSEVAGRGVGLDVLREAAERLRGEIKLHTTRGVGFSVELVVPVSAAALMGLWVESDGTQAALPLESVVQCLRLPAGAVARGTSGESLLHEGKVIPFFPLSRSLRPDRDRERTKPHSAVVLRAGSGQHLAVGVDRVLGTRMVVLRRMPPLAAASAVVAGAAQSEAGRAELVLDPEGLLQTATKLSGHRSLPPVAAPRLLVVDDSVTTRMLEQSILESAGFLVDVAASGEEGLLEAQACAYGAILCDVEMPGIDGFTFVERMRADPKLRNTPTVLVSSRAAPEDLARGKAAGAAGYIVKGRFDQRELLQLIRKLTGG